MILLSLKLVHYLKSPLAVSHTGPSRFPGRAIAED